ncbi:MAG: MATE family efflux transporter [Endozoicomonas sp.]
MSQYIDLEKNSIGRTLFQYALPSTMAVWIFALYTMVDGMFVGKGVGADALVAVNLSLPFISIVFAISILVTIGAATITGVKKGQGDHEGASRVFSTTIYALLIFGLTACFFSYVFIEEIAWLLGARNEMIPLVVEYLSTLLMFKTFYLVAYSMEVFVKVDGFPKRELMAICLAALTNIFLDYILVIKLGMGLRGAAIATGCAQLLQAVLLLTHFFGKFKESGTLKFIQIWPSFREVFRFVRIGLPDCITEMSSGLVLLAFNNAILLYLSTTELAAFSVIGYANNLMLLTMIGLTQGMQPIVTFLRGRQQSADISRVVGLTMKAAFVICSASYGVVYFFGDTLASMFLTDPELISLSHQVMKTFCIAFIFMGLNIVISGFFTALEQPGRAGIISVLRGGALAIALLTVFPLVYGAEGIWYVAPVSEMITFAVSVILISLKLNSMKEAHLVPAAA